VGLYLQAILPLLSWEEAMADSLSLSSQCEKWLIAQPSSLLSLLS
jgi:hypothetical protein